MKPNQGALITLAFVVLIFLALNAFPGGRVMLEQMSAAIGGLLSWLSSAVEWLWGALSAIATWLLGAGLFLLGALSPMFFPILAAFIARSVLVAGLDRNWDQEHYVQTGYHVLFSLGSGILIALGTMIILVRATTDIASVHDFFGLFGPVHWDFFEHVPTGWGMYALAVSLIVYAISPGEQKLENI